MRTRKVERKSTRITGQCCTVQGRLFDIIVADLTDGGCCFTDPQNAVSVAAPVNLMISGTGPHRAHVRWRDRANVGVSFDRPLAAPVLQAILSGEVGEVAPAKSAADFDTGAETLAPLRRFC